MLTGISGAYKYSLYSSLSNKILVVDDLERVGCASIIKNILGECFNLSVADNNVKVLVIANSDKIDNEADLEKSFHDIVTIQYEPTKMVEIASGYFPGLLSEKLKHELTSFITFQQNQSLTNIRVLKRILAKFFKLKSKLAHIENIDHELAEESLLKQMVLICFAKYELHYPIEVIKAAPSVSRIFQVASQINSNKVFEAKDEKQESEQEFEKRVKQEVLDKLFSNHPPNKKLVDFCCLNTDVFEDLIVDLNLPVNDTVMDKLLHHQLRFRLVDEEVQNGINDVIKYIKFEDCIDLTRFFNCCSCLIEIIEGRYITVQYSRNDVLVLANELTYKRINPNTIEHRYRGSAFEDTELEQLYRDKQSEFELLRQKENTKSFAVSFKKSFDAVLDTLYEKYQQKPFLTMFDAKELINILLDWKPADIYSFATFLSGQYRFNNIEDFFKPQHELLLATANTLSNEVKDMQPCLKLGALNELMKILESINERMTNRLAEKIKE